MVGLGAHNFYMCTQNGFKLEIRILIHTLELMLWHYEVFPYYECFTPTSYVMGVVTHTRT